MIVINGDIIPQSMFPDETPHLKFDPVENAIYPDDIVSPEPTYKILWLYERMSEIFNLLCLVDKIRSVYEYRAYTVLSVPYLPNARMDRCERKDDVFTLQTLTKLINSCHFDEVQTFDAHSKVSLDKLACSYDEFPSVTVRQTLHKLKDDFNIANPVLCYPDEGAARRYAEGFDFLQLNSVVLEKQRDWDTGKIIGLEVAEGEHLIRGSNFLIIDDICSKGGTFYYAAQKLKELGANSVFLYVSHLERTVHDGKLLKEDSPIDHIFTTNSIYRWGSKNRITVLDYWKG